MSSRATDVASRKSVKEIRTHSGVPIEHASIQERFCPLYVSNPATDPESKCCLDPQVKEAKGVK